MDVKEITINMDGYENCSISRFHVLLLYCFLYINHFVGDLILTKFVSLFQNALPPPPPPPPQSQSSAVGAAALNAGQRPLPTAGDQSGRQRPTV